MVEPVIQVADGAQAPDGLAQAVLAYEAALMADDLDALAAFFEPGPATVRADRAGVLVGHDRITGFRGRRGGVGSRRVEAMLVHPLAEGLAHVTTVNAPARGGRGAVTQLWRRTPPGEGAGPGAWRIVAAHVTAPAAALDRSIWREVGSPLVPGAGAGPLAGLTVAVKDLFAVEGRRIGVGVKAFLAEAPVQERSAAAVQALLDAGADVLGIAQTDQFAYSIAGLNPDYGTPPNGAVPGAVPGGSSSGPASAVALGQADIGLGSDTAGSIRVPASYQGLWGLRPTHGAVSLEDVHPLAPRYDTAGWLTRDGATMRTVAAVSLDGRPSVEPAARLYAAPAVGMACAPEVRAAFHGALERLVEGGWEISPVDVPDLGDLLTAFRVTQSAEAWRSDGAWVESHPGALAPDVEARFAWARDITPEREAEALADVTRLAIEIEAALGDGVLLLPSAASAAPSLDADDATLESRRQATLSMTAIAGLTGRPGLSVPVLTTPAGPVGLCLVGPKDSERALIELGMALAAALGQTGTA